MEKLICKMIHHSITNGGIYGRKGEDVYRW